MDGGLREAAKVSFEVDLLGQKFLQVQLNFFLDRKTFKSDVIQIDFRYFLARLCLIFP